MTQAQQNDDEQFCPWENEMLSPLHSAVEAGDSARVQELVSGGADIEERKAIGKLRRQEGMKVFRPGHLVRLVGLNHAAFDGKLARVVPSLRPLSGRHFVEFVDDRTGPPAPALRSKKMPIKPENMQLTCEHCPVAEEGGITLQICGKCRTARYCNVACQRADWPRHQTSDCIRFSYLRSISHPIHQACIYGNFAEVRRLVEEKGSNIEKSSRGGPTPLILAAEKGHVDVVEYLLEQGADVDKASDGGETPLHSSSRHCQMAMVKCLVEHGADKDKVNNDGQTPIHLAAEGYQWVTVKYLIDQGADMNKADNEGRTPLHLAVEHDVLEMVLYLVQQGADKERVDNKGRTPLARAQNLDCSKIVVECLKASNARR